MRRYFDHDRYPLQGFSAVLCGNMAGDDRGLSSQQVEEENSKSDTAARKNPVVGFIYNEYIR